MSTLLPTSAVYLDQCLPDPTGDEIKALCERVAALERKLADK